MLHDKNDKRATKRNLGQQNSILSRFLPFSLQIRLLIGMIKLDPRSCIQPKSNDEEKRERQLI
jgi:hypothetical protein